MEAAVLQVFVACAIGAGIGLGIGACGCGIGQGIGLKGAVEGVARNPESSGKITVTLLIGLAMIESLTIYALVIAFMLVLKMPDVTQLMGLIGH